MDGKRRSGQRALRDAEVRAGRAQNGAPVPARTHFSSMDGRKTQRRGGLLFGDFLLATQEKVTRAPGRRAGKDKDVVHPLPATSRWIPDSALRAAPEWRRTKCGRRAESAIPPRLRRRAARAFASLRPSFRRG